MGKGIAQIHHVLKRYQGRQPRLRFLFQKPWSGKERCSGWGETKLFPPRILLPATASQIQIHCKHCLRLLATASDSHHMAWEAWNNFKIKINSERRTWAPTPTFTIEATRICACTQRCSLMTISQIRSASTEANHLKRSNLRSPQQWEKASLKYIMYSKDTRAGNPSNHCPGIDEYLANAMPSEATRCTTQVERAIANRRGAHAHTHVQEPGTAHTDSTGCHKLPVVV